MRFFKGRDKPNPGPSRPTMYTVESWARGYGDIRKTLLDFANMSSASIEIKNTHAFPLMRTTVYFEVVGSDVAIQRFIYYMNGMVLGGWDVGALVVMSV